VAVGDGVADGSGAGSGVAVGSGVGVGVLRGAGDGNGVAAPIAPAPACMFAGV
jgi:hypothetical protein